MCLVGAVGLGNIHRHVHFPFPLPPPLIIWLKPLCEPQLHGVGAGSLVGSCFEKGRRRRCLAAEPLQSAPQQLLSDNTGIIIGLFFYSRVVLTLFSRLKRGGDWSLPAHEIL